jgi:hypothetical protein
LSAAAASPAAAAAAAASSGSSSAHLAVHVEACKQTDTQGGKELCWTAARATVDCLQHTVGLQPPPNRHTPQGSPATPQGSPAKRQRSNASNGTLRRPALAAADASRARSCSRAAARASSSCTAARGWLGQQQAANEGAVAGGAHLAAGWLVLSAGRGLGCVVRGVGW